jgi:hypothetical protein
MTLIRLKTHVRVLFSIISHVVEDVDAFYPHNINSNTPYYRGPPAGSSSLILAFKDGRQVWPKSQ